MHRWTNEHKDRMTDIWTDRGIKNRQMDSFMNLWMDRLMYVVMDYWMDRRMDGWMDVWIN